ncbi:MAG TPA: HD domain-containing protein [Methylomirabilota bacterium]|jgi:poly(A) polymerase/tRNA nucleotidyltransferase (CCA-adding enzyme)
MGDFLIRRLGPLHITLLRAVLGAAGRQVEPVLVGGAVRDGCLGRPGPIDLDVAVPARGPAIARRVADRLGGAFVLLDAERGAGRVIVDGQRLDVADYRAATLEQDLIGRDFTVNALAVPIRALLRSGRAPVIDPTGGLEDLRFRRLRLPAPGALEADPVRTLRGVRLEATLGFRLTATTARAIVAAAPGLARVSVERVRDEVAGLLALADTAGVLRRADRLRLLAIVLPEVEPMRITRQPPPHRFAVLEHSLRAVGGADIVVARPHLLAPFGEELAGHLSEPLAGGFTRAHTLKLAALLHDVAKPQTRRLVGGRVRFFEHDVRGEASVRLIGERLRLPGAVAGVLARLVRHHLRPMHLGGAGEVTARARYRFYRDLGPETRDLLLLALVDAAAVRGQSPLAIWPRAELIRDLLRGWQRERQASAAPPLLRGQDVMARFGLAPGPTVGWLLGRAREAQDLGLVATREEALAYLDSHAGGP